MYTAKILPICVWLMRVWLKKSHLVYSGKTELNFEIRTHPGFLSYFHFRYWECNFSCFQKMNLYKRKFEVKPRKIELTVKMKKSTISRLNAMVWKLSSRKNYRSRPDASRSKYVRYLCAKSADSVNRIQIVIKQAETRNLHVHFMWINFLTGNNILDAIPYLIAKVTQSTEASCACKH